MRGQRAPLWLWQHCNVAGRKTRATRAAKCCVTLSLGSRKYRIGSWPLPLHDHSHDCGRSSLNRMGPALAADVGTEPAELYRPWRTSGTIFSRMLLCRLELANHWLQPVLQGALALTCKIEGSLSAIRIDVQLRGR